MASLYQLRMQKHELAMRQMVAEIHQGKLNIAQAAAKFEVTRKTVQHWVEIVEEEAEANGLPPAQPPTPPPVRKRSSRTMPEDSEEVKGLKAKVYALEKELETANFKALYYTTLMRVAEEELGIDIEKSPVPKRRTATHPGHAEHARSSSHSAVRRMSASAVRLVLAVRPIISIGSVAGRKLVTRFRSSNSSRSCEKTTPRWGLASFMTY